MKSNIEALGSSRKRHPVNIDISNHLKPSINQTNMSSSIPLQIAETIQTASLKRNPSPTHDVNPSTAASRKEPVQFSHQPPVSDSSIEKYAYDEDDAIDEDDEEDIPYSVLKPTPRRASFGPLPDLRFEQSYLASIAGADSRWKVLYITARDQASHKSFLFWNPEQKLIC
jgi:hypothetical protein